jgi:hypothetical protein
VSDIRPTGAEYVIGTDAHGSLICPIPGCDAELYLNRTYSIPLGMPDDGDDDTGSPVDAVTDGWDVGCIEGHTIDRNDQSSDWREPFSVRWLLAVGHGQPPRCGYCNAAFDVGEAWQFDEDGASLHPGECYGQWQLGERP